MWCENLKKKNVSSSAHKHDHTVLNGQVVLLYKNRFVLLEAGDEGMGKGSGGQKMKIVLPVFNRIYDK